MVLGKVEWRGAWHQRKEDGSWRNKHTGDVVDDEDHIIKMEKGPYTREVTRKHGFGPDAAYGGKTALHPPLENKMRLRDANEEKSKFKAEVYRTRKIVLRRRR